MPIAKKRSIIYLLQIVAALVVAYCLRFVFHDMTDNALAGTAMMTLRWAIQVPLTVFWCFSIRRRMLDPGIRNMLLSVGALLLLWQVVRVIKYDYVIITEPVGRYCWYAFYIGMIFVPLIGVFVINRIGRPDGYRTPGWMKYLFIPASVLLAVVFTNDLHQCVFVFYNGFELYNNDYSYGFMYIIVMAWFVVLTLFFVIGLMVRSRVPGSRRFQTMPLLIGIFGIFFWASYSFGFLRGDITAVDSLIIIALLESAIQSGLIPSNMHYRELFAQSTIAARIVDQHQQTRYASSGAAPLSPAVMDKARREPVDLGGAILHGQSIRGGHVYWQVDVKTINELAEHLREANETLGERYDLLKAEVELKERRLQTEEKSRLYDRIAQEIAPQLNKADELLQQSREHPGRANGLLSQVCVISAYIKRRANLILLGEEKAAVSAHELASCLRESLDNLRLCGVMTYLDCRCEALTPVRHIIAAYSLFEEVTEMMIGRMSAMMVTAEEKEGSLCLRIQVGCREILTDCPSFTLPGGTVSCEIQDEDMLIEASIAGGGVTV